MLYTRQVQTSENEYEFRQALRIAVMIQQAVEYVDP
jgi:hypothetical protein